jgi:hypothetical protein
MDLFEELTAILHALDDAGVETALCGGLAVAVHGHVRATKDIDLLIEPQAVERALDAIAPLGFRFRANPMTFADGMRIQRVSRIHGGDLLTVDLLLVGPESRAAWESRTRFAMGELTLPVVTRDALIQLKLWAGRPQDLADVERLTDVDR